MPGEAVCRESLICAGTVVQPRVSATSVAAAVALVAALKRSPSSWPAVPSTFFSMILLPASPIFYASTYLTVALAIALAITAAFLLSIVVLASALMSSISLVVTAPDSSPSSESTETLEDVIL